MYIQRIRENKFLNNMGYVIKLSWMNCHWINHSWTKNYEYTRFLIFISTRILKTLSLYILFLINCLKF